MSPKRRQQRCTQSSDTSTSPSPLALGTQFRQPLMEQSKSVYLHHSKNSGSMLPNTTSPSAQHETIYTATSVPSYLQWRGMERTSYCELEIDTTAMMIVNRLDIKERDIHADLDKEIQQPSTEATDADDKLVKSLAGIWKDERRRRKQWKTATPIPSVKKIDEENHQRQQHQPWSTEEKTRAMLKTMLEQQQQQQPDENHTYPTIMTTFQLIEALYPNGFSDFVQKQQQQQQQQQRQQQPSSSTSDTSSSLESNKPVSTTTTTTLSSSSTEWPDSPYDPNHQP
ncbi:unnamed protein product [Absidia cylindrospora]